MNMASSNSELSLECKPHQSYSMLLKSFGEKNIDQAQNLEEFLARLEEERVKIDAFKRELPLCMQLLTNAMEASRQQLQSHRENNHIGHRPVLEEFIPLKNNNASVELGTEKIVANNTSTIVDNKANWMTSAQLWSPPSDHQETKQQTTSNKENDHHHMAFSVGPKLALDNNNSSCPSSTTLALASSNKQNINETLIQVEDHNNKNLEVVNINNLQQDAQGIGGGTNNTSTSSQQQQQQQPHRKARRCWSPDLHRRFVNALQMLGGSQGKTFV